MKQKEDSYLGKTKMLKNITKGGGGPLRVIAQNFDPLDEPIMNQVAADFMGGATASAKTKTGRVYCM